MNSTTRRTARHVPAGFATITAVFLIALVATALTAAAALLAAESRRTRVAVDDARLRQLLLAGEAAARQHLERRRNNDPAGAVPLALPAELAAAGARVEIHFGPAGAGESVDVRIDASLDAAQDAGLGRRHAWQSLRFTRSTSGTWQLVWAELNPPADEG